MESKFCFFVVVALGHLLAIKWQRSKYLTCVRVYACELDERKVCAFAAALAFPFECRRPILLLISL